MFDSHLVVRLIRSEFGGRRSQRPPLEFVVAGFLIVASTDSCALVVSMCISSSAQYTIQVQFLKNRLNGIPFQRIDYSIHKIVHSILS